LLGIAALRFPVSMLSVINRTDPSHIAIVTPDSWKLLADTTVGLSRAVAAAVAVHDTLLGGITVKKQECPGFESTHLCPLLPPFTVVTAALVIVKPSD